MVVTGVQQMEYRPLILLGQVTALTLLRDLNADRGSDGGVSGCLVLPTAVAVSGVLGGARPACGVAMAWGSLRVPSACTSTKH